MTGSITASHIASSSVKDAARMVGDTGDPTRVVSTDKGNVGRYSNL